MTVTIVSGTNRQRSTTKQVTDVVEPIYASLGATAQIADLANLPVDVCSPSMYHSEGRAARGGPLLEMIEAADALVVCVPEYNGGIPGVLKMVIDLLPAGDYVLGGRPVAFIGIAAGRCSGLRGVEQGASVFAYRKAFVFPEHVLIRECDSLLDSRGRRVLTPVLHRRLCDQAARFLEFSRAVRCVRDGFVATSQPG